MIDDPILNGPYDEPTRHFRFDDQGITEDVVAARRPSSYFVPAPRPRKGARQLEIAELTADQIEVNRKVNDIRDKVALWRLDGYAGATPTTRALLEHWADAARDNRVLFCQREAAETAIYVSEVAERAGQGWIGTDLARTNSEHNGALPRIALKMATGSGKTVVMAMLIAWQTLNKVAAPYDRRFTKRFLVITPGITIRDRLRVLLPPDPENYYDLRDLVPTDLRGRLGEARVAITNFHGLMLRETAAGRGVSATTKSILAPDADAPSPFRETPDQMVARVIRDLGGGSTQVLVLNDEAHHCYRGRLDAPDEGADTEQTLTGDDRRSAKERNAEARIWFTGLAHLHRRLGLKQVVDLSATPFFLAGSGYREGTLFPWVVSDFSLIDAIESGIVKIPRMPVDDDRVASRVTYLDLWSEVRESLPSRSRTDAFTADQLPGALEGALFSLYGSYERRYRKWADAPVERRGPTPPVFIVVCSNTTVSKAVYDWIGGWQRPVPAADATEWAPGRLELLSNVVDGRVIERPRTLLVDSQVLASGDSLSPEFKRAAAAEIETFKAEARQRFAGRGLDDPTDEDLLREVMNTVGKPGRLGEHVRCVVSVAMLTEGWDANTVTHILGVRAFGTQLLCEQVVGRGLRRESYALDPDTGRFPPEYADVYGVPFQFIPTVAATKDIAVRPSVRVHAVDGRAGATITFPRFVGYRVEVPDAALVANFDPATRPRITKESLPTATLSSGVIGETEIHDLSGLADQRVQRVAFEVARELVQRHLSTPDEPRPWLFPQAVPIVARWLSEWVEYGDDCFPGLFLLRENAHWAAEQIWHEFLRYPDVRPAHVLAVLRDVDPVGSTAEVDFATTRQVMSTAEEKCHVNFVVLDGAGGNAWERTTAQALEAAPEVAAYVKNDHLGFTIPYTHQGRSRQFVPDFLARLRSDDGVVRTLVIEVSGGRKDQATRAAKAATARDQWVPAVNRHGGFGRWAFVEIDDPANARKIVAAAAAELLTAAHVAAELSAADG